MIEDRVHCFDIIFIEQEWNLRRAWDGCVEREARGGGMEGFPWISGQKSKWWRRRLWLCDFIAHGILGGKC